MTSPEASPAHQAMAQDITTDVLIVGGGPAGLMLAIELGCRGVACVVLEEDSGPPTLPKANATSSRTMSITAGAALPTAFARWACLTGMPRTSPTTPSWLAVSWRAFMCRSRRSGS